jgi:hypothetical protein
MLEKRLSVFKAHFLTLLKMTALSLLINMTLSAASCRLSNDEAFEISFHFWYYLREFAEMRARRRGLKNLILFSFILDLDEYPAACCGCFIIIKPYHSCKIIF